jgi:hypothetical protein
VQQFLQEFLEAIFFGVAMESQLGDEKVLLGKTRITAQKNYNFLSYCWIVQQFLQEFLEVVFLRVAIDS